MLFNLIKGEKKAMFKICIVGLGYIGLPTAGTFSNKGINVVGVDVKQEVIDD